MTCIRTFAAFGLLALLSACSSIPHNPPPAEIYESTTFLDRDDLRYWGDISREQVEQFKTSHVGAGGMRESREGIADRPHHYLAISGGGANGAYGAGILAGWSELGTRPEFTIVTGISTGALTAPFAFLGSDYDAQLKEIYTTLHSDSIFKTRGLLAGLTRDGLADTTPLAKSLEKYLTDAMIEEIAAQYRRGRMLLIGTTNLDAGRPVIWNIGRIADSGHPDAPRLIRDILRASASIPGAFPPVYLPVEGPDGRTYDEMHVDGGTAAQMFLYPSNVDWRELQEDLNVQGRPQAYIIRNSQVRPEYSPVDPKLPAIAAKTIDTLIRNQGVGDAYRIYALADRDGVDVFITWIPRDAVDVESDEVFDPDYMSALFDLAARRTLNGETWKQAVGPQGQMIRVETAQ